jgi:ABC-type antimicrobial peptide transport system permease subunit
MMSSRLASQILTALGLLALVLAAVGLYSVIAYLTSLRTKEIGIRVAVGADRPTILMTAMKQAIPMVFPGLIVGTVLAYYLTPALAIPFDFVPRDLTVATIVPIFFAGIAVLASLIPARRAARVDPLVALRYE